MTPQTHSRPKREYDAHAEAAAPLLIEVFGLTAEISRKTLLWSQADPPAAHHDT